MPVWSSPFPCDPLPELESVPFPGPPGSLVLFDSPDRVLLTWKAAGLCDGAELERLQEGYRVLVKLHQAGEHTVLARWQVPQADAQAPIPDGITAALLLLWLQATPEGLADYLQLDAHYLQRMLRAQGQPRQILNQWLRHPAQSLDRDQPLEQQLHSTLEEMERLKRSEEKMTILMEQVRDQQRRTRRLLGSLLPPDQPFEAES